MQGKIYVVDMDGVLCFEGAYPHYCDAKPIHENISVINRLYIAGHSIVIHTARLQIDKAITEKWLRENGVRYSALFLDKPRGDYYVDDKHIDTQEMKKHADLYYPN